LVQRKAKVKKKKATKGGVPGTTLAIRQGKNRGKPPPCGGKVVGNSKFWKKNLGQKERQNLDRTHDLGNLFAGPKSTKQKNDGREKNGLNRIPLRQ